jgi:pimeloyl-ACP methyl ester carboxylesterase
VGARVQLGEVDTYYEDDGEGDPLVLLHPGLADSRAWEANTPGLAERFRVLRPDRRGHGRTPDVEGPITYGVMASDTVRFVEEVVGGPTVLVGHSDGSPVALLAALERPDLVRALVLSAGIYHHEGWAPGVLDVDEELKEFFAGYRGEVAPDGRERFEAVYEKLDRTHREDPTLRSEDLAGYGGPALVMIGDGDPEIPWEHTHALRDGLRAQLAVVPGTGHGLPSEKPGLFNRLVSDFIDEVAA